MVKHSATEEQENVREQEGYQDQGHAQLDQGNEPGWVDEHQSAEGQVDKSQDFDKDVAGDQEPDNSVQVSHPAKASAEKDQPEAKNIPSGEVEIGDIEVVESGKGEVTDAEMEAEKQAEVADRNDEQGVNSQVPSEPNIVEESSEGTDSHNVQESSDAPIGESTEIPPQEEAQIPQLDQTSNPPSLGDNSQTREVGASNSADMVEQESVCSGPDQTEDIKHEEQEAKGQTLEPAEPGISPQVEEDESAQTRAESNVQDVTQSESGDVSEMPGKEQTESGDAPEIESHQLSQSDATLDPEITTQEHSQQPGQDDGCEGVTDKNNDQTQSQETKCQTEDAVDSEPCVSIAQEVENVTSPHDGGTNSESNEETREDAVEQNTQGEGDEGLRSSAADGSPAQTAEKAGEEEVEAEQGQQASASVPESAPVQPAPSISASESLPETQVETLRDHEEQVPEGNAVENESSPSLVDESQNRVVNSEPETPYVGIEESNEHASGPQMGSRDQESKDWNPGDPKISEEEEQTGEDLVFPVNNDATVQDESNIQSKGSVIEEPAQILTDEAVAGIVEGEEESPGATQEAAADSDYTAEDAPEKSIGASDTVHPVPGSHAEVTSVTVEDHPAERDETEPETAQRMPETDVTEEDEVFDERKRNQGQTTELEHAADDAEVQSQNVPDAAENSTEGIVDSSEQVRGRANMVEEEMNEDVLAAQPIVSEEPRPPHSPKLAEEGDREPNAQIEQPKADQEHQLEGAAEVAAQTLQDEDKMTHEEENRDDIEDENTEPAAEDAVDISEERSPSSEAQKAAEIFKDEDQVAHEEQGRGASEGQILEPVAQEATTVPPDHQAEVAPSEEVLEAVPEEAEASESVSKLDEPFAGEQESQGHSIEGLEQAESPSDRSRFAPQSVPSICISEPEEPPEKLVVSDYVLTDEAVSSPIQEAVSELPGGDFPSVTIEEVQDVTQAAEAEEPSVQEPSPQEPVVQPEITEETPTAVTEVPSNAIGDTAVVQADSVEESQPDTAPGTGIPAEDESPRLIPNPSRTPTIEVHDVDGALSDIGEQDSEQPSNLDVQATIESEPISTRDIDQTRDFVDESATQVTERSDEPASPESVTAVQPTPECKELAEQAPEEFNDAEQKGEEAMPTDKEPVASQDTTATPEQDIPVPLEETNGIKEADLIDAADHASRESPPESELERQMESEHVKPSPVPKGITPSQSDATLFDEDPIDKSYVEKEADKAEMPSLTTQDMMQINAAVNEAMADVVHATQDIADEAAALKADLEQVAEVERDATDADRPLSTEDAIPAARDSLERLDKEFLEDSLGAAAEAVLQTLDTVKEEAYQELAEHDPLDANETNDLAHHLNGQPDDATMVEESAVEETASKESESAVVQTIATSIVTETTAVDETQENTRVTITETVAVGEVSEEQMVTPADEQTEVSTPESQILSRQLTDAFAPAAPEPVQDAIVAAMDEALSLSQSAAPEEEVTQTVTVEVTTAEESRRISLTQTLVQKVEESEGLQHQEDSGQVPSDHESAIQDTPDEEVTEDMPTTEMTTQVETEIVSDEVEVVLEEKEEKAGSDFAKELTQSIQSGSVPPTPPTRTVPVSSFAEKLVAVQSANKGDTELQLVTKRKTSITNRRTELSSLLPAEVQRSSLLDYCPEPLSFQGPVLIRLTGKRRQFLVHRVNCHHSSITKGDAFILDYFDPMDTRASRILVYTPQGCNIFRKMRAREIANEILAREWKNRSKIVEIGSDGSNPDLELFYELIGAPDSLRIGTIENAVGPFSLSLHMYSKRHDSVREELIWEQDLGIENTSTGLSGKVLESDNVYVLKCSYALELSEVYVWIGNTATDEVLTRAKTALEHSTVPVTYELDGDEHILFREKFADWTAARGGATSPTAATPARKMGTISPKATSAIVMPLQNGSPFRNRGLPPPAPSASPMLGVGFGRGSRRGSTDSHQSSLSSYNNPSKVSHGKDDLEDFYKRLIQRKASSQKHKLHLWALPPEGHHTKFVKRTRLDVLKQGTNPLTVVKQMMPEDPGFNEVYTAEAYIFMQNGREDRDEMGIVWIGLEADTEALEKQISRWERDTGFLVGKRVYQGKEPVWFLYNFSSPLVIRRSNVESLDPTLFRVFAYSPSHIRIIESPNCHPRALCSGSSYVLVCPKFGGSAIYVWHGEGTVAYEKKAARAFAATYKSRDKCTVDEVDEFSEPDSFWNDFVPSTKSETTARAPRSASPKDVAQVRRRPTSPRSRPVSVMFDAGGRGAGKHRPVSMHLSASMEFPDILAQQANQQPQAHTAHHRHMFVVPVDRRGSDWYASGDFFKRRAMVGKWETTMPALYRILRVREAPVSRWSAEREEAYDAANIPVEERVMSLSNAQETINSPVEYIQFDHVLPPYSHTQDLKETDIVLLDAHFQVFVWIGKAVWSRTSRGRILAVLELAMEYARLMKTDGRFDPVTDVSVIGSGAEPSLFKSFFANWTTVGASCADDAIPEGVPDKSKTNKQSVNLYWLLKKLQQAQKTEENEE